MIIVTDKEDFKEFEIIKNIDYVSNIDLFEIKKIKNNWKLTSCKFALKMKENVINKISINLFYQDSNLEKMVMKDLNKNKRIIEFEDDNISKDTIVINRNKKIYQYDFESKSFIFENEIYISDLSEDWILTKIIYYKEFLENNCQEYKIKKCKVLSNLHK